MLHIYTIKDIIYYYMDIKYYNHMCIKIIYDDRYMNQTICIGENKYL